MDTAKWNKPEGLAHPMPGSKAPVSDLSIRKGLKGRHINSEYGLSFRRGLSMCQPFRLSPPTRAQQVVSPPAKDVSAHSGLRTV